MYTYKKNDNRMPHTFKLQPAKLLRFTELNECMKFIVLWKVRFNK